MKNKQVKKKQIFKSLNRKLIILVIVTAIISFSSQIYITSQVGTKTAEVDYIASEKSRLRLENAILKSKIDQALSIENIEKSVAKYDLQEKQVIELETSNISAQN